MCEHAKDAPRLGLGIFPELILNARAVVVQELFDRTFCLFVLARILKPFKCPQIPTTSLFEWWNGELWQLILAGKRPRLGWVGFEARYGIGHRAEGRQRSRRWNMSRGLEM